ncbi:helix-turn-helix transcriptional regulator [Halocatena halophila]|uniref:helix-turn-helix transcriptional regulator n=1 Tax=Halocatena halophila TaxID=2814576 RepID=UPI002ECFC795
MDDNNQAMQDRLEAIQINDVWNCIERLSNSVQRIRVLAALIDTHADLRELMDGLTIPRTTLQRNLSLLEEHNWIKRDSSGYTTTTRGRLLVDAFIEMLEKFQRIDALSPFLAEVDHSRAIDISQLNDIRVTVPEPNQPHAPMSRLFDSFNRAKHIRGCLPFVSWLLIEYSPTVDEISAVSHEYVVSRTALETLDTQYTTGCADIGETNGVDINVYVFEDDLPYGLFISEDGLILAAYNEIGRIQALVESEHETAIEWGRQTYETYRQQSQQLRESDIPTPT